MITGDPLYVNGVDAAVVAITVFKVVLTFAFLMVAVMFMVWFIPTEIARH